MLMGAAIGGFQGFIIAYIGVPSFIVTLGGLLRSAARRYLRRRDVSGLDPIFQLLGGGRTGSLGGTAELGSRLVGCIGDRRAAHLLPAPRRRLRVPGPADVGRGPARGRRHRRGPRPRLVRQQLLLAEGPGGQVRAAEQHSDPAPGRPADPDRVPVPDHPADRRHARDDLDGHPAAVRPLRVRVRRQPRRRRAGRHQHALDDPQDVRPHGRPVRACCGDRLRPAQRATLDIGQSYELYVIAAAVVGGTSFAGGIGTIPGAVLGASSSARWPTA